MSNRERIALLLFKAYCVECAMDPADWPSFSSPMQAAWLAAADVAIFSMFEAYKLGVARGRIDADTVEATFDEWLAEQALIP